MGFKNLFFFGKIFSFQKQFLELGKSLAEFRCNLGEKRVKIKKSQF